MADKAFTGALGLIKVKGQVIGRMRSISGSETYTRGSVMGLGTITEKEAPILNFRGTFTAGSYLIDLTKGVPGMKKSFQTVQEWEDYLILNEERLQVDVFKKVSDAIDENGNPIPNLKPFAIIQNVLIETDNWNLSEGQVGGRDQNFKYLTPILEQV